MRINVPGRVIIPYPSTLLQNAIIAADNTWNEYNELTTVLSEALITESEKGVRMFKYRSWWYWYDFGDGTPGHSRPPAWLRSYTKPQITGGTPLRSPNMTETQRLALTSCKLGDRVYQTDNAEGEYVYKSTGWKLLG
jgi:hypothetical protein